MTTRTTRGLLPLALLALLFWGCAGARSPKETSTSSPSPAALLVTSPTLAPTPTESPAPTPTPQEESTPVASIEICSPLEGESIAALSQPDLLKNPFAPPRPGYDDGHFGIDLAYWTDKDGKSMQGLPVHAVLGGEVAGVIANRMPYGYAVIIETPVDQVFPEIFAQSLLPTPAAELQPGIGLSCPAYNFSVDTPQRSIYTLYAHLDQPPTLEPGDRVTCGQTLGVVGTTGRSVNFHLHLETRAGPAGMRFASFAHYDNSATQEEMRLYCLWRISGAFPAIDPLLLFAAAQQDR